MIIGTTELIERTGITKRQARSWVKAGVIPTVSGNWPGSGHKLEFDVRVVNMVAFLVTVANDFFELGNVNVGILHLISENWERGQHELPGGLILRWR